MQRSICTLKTPGKANILAGIVIISLAAYGTSGIGRAHGAGPQLPLRTGSQDFVTNAISTVQKVNSLDHLVIVNMRVVWASSLIQKAGQAAPAPLSRMNNTDFLVTVNNRSVWASTLRRVEGPDTTRPAPQHNVACRDYLVEVGKHAVWASSTNAPCPMGMHKGETKPLCCIASISDAKKLPPCCKVG